MRRLVAAALLLSAATRAQAGPPEWAPTGTFSNTLNVVATVFFDGAEADYENDMLAAFVGGESRGLAVPVRLGSTGGHVFFLTIGSNASRDGEAVKFKAYDASTGTERVLCEAIAFRAGTTRGTPSAPFALHAGDSDGPGDCPVYWTSPPGFSRYMVVNAAVFFDGLPAGPGDRVAALVDGEVRGVGEAVIDPSGSQYYQMVVWGDVAGEEIRFRTYDDDAQLTYAPEVSVRFAANTAAGTASRPLVLNASVPLPVELVSFTATLDGSAVRLAWQTAGETNNAGFDVQMRESPGGSGTAPGHLAWRPIAFVEGRGTTGLPARYSYRVVGLAPGRHQFRLRQLDFDGAFHYSPAVEVEVAPEEVFFLLAAAPNPFRDATQFTLTVAHAQQVRVTVFDLLGRPVRHLYDGMLDEGSTLPILLNGESLSGGAYVVSITGERFRTVQIVTRLH